MLKTLSKPSLPGPLNLKMDQERTQACAGSCPILPGPGQNVLKALNADHTKYPHMRYWGQVLQNRIGENFDYLPPADNARELQQFSSDLQLCSAIRVLAKEHSLGSLSDEQEQKLEGFLQELYEQNEKSYAPRSFATYSAIFVYEVDGRLRFFTAANIDQPQGLDARCAEIGTSKFAQETLRKENKKGKLIFGALFRKMNPSYMSYVSRHKGKDHFDTNQLLPCSACKKFATQLANNNGALMVFNDKKLLNKAGLKPDDFAMKMNSSEYGVHLKGPEELASYEPDAYLGSVNA